MEEVIKCHSSHLVKPSRRTSSDSIRFPVGNTSGRRILVRSFCSSAPLDLVQNSLFSVLLRLSRRGLLSRVEVRRVLRRLSSRLRQFLSSRQEAIDSNSLLTRLAVSHRQLMVSLSSTRSEDFDDGNLQRNTQRALQSGAAKNLRHQRQSTSSSTRRRNPPGPWNLFGG